ncbi:MAG: Ig-like domain-containing protein [Gammaproteobacteria bacterium]|nr:Ig-like domain-containing protein [Gammaproteobacteria bacterium]MDH3506384.1 Ig-like domain-containing protein [Gammaproteobacteria bacterium]
MRKLKLLVTMAAVAFLTACGSGSDDSLVNAGGAGGVVANVASVTALTSRPTIQSDGSENATITALVRDNNNNVMPNVPVLFAASSGSLILGAQIVTDDNGIVTATLAPGGDPTNRTITVTATAGGSAQASVTVDVINTTLLINGPDSLAAGDTGAYTIVLADAGGNGISGEQVTIASSAGNGLSSTLLTTDVDGRATFDLTATANGTDTITVAALGLTSTQDVDISTDVFAFQLPLAAPAIIPPAPATTPEIPLNQNQTLQVLWSDTAGPVVNQQVTFQTSRGTLVPANGVVLTNASGIASVTLISTNAGGATITATNQLNTSTQLGVEFVATISDSLELQADPFTIATNDQSTITAIVRDPNGNLVKGAVVSFNLTDITNGSVSPQQAVTNSQGRAQTFYNSSSTTSPIDGVQIDATVIGSPGATDTVLLTVARRELFIAIGTGNEIEEPNTAQYRQEWIVQVTDADGNGVDLVELTVGILSERYWEGTRAYYTPPGAWLTQIGVEALPALGCTDEDRNRNGILDPLPPPDEDFNGSGEIEAGNIASVVAQNPGPNGEVITDTNGFALIDVFWPQDHALWVEVTLEARAAVQGTETRASATFRLPILASDVQQQNQSPPGINSPFGTDGNCATPN